MLGRYVENGAGASKWVGRDDRIYKSIPCGLKINPYYLDLHEVQPNSKFRFREDPSLLRDVYLLTTTGSGLYTIGPVQLIARHSVWTPFSLPF